MGGRANQFRHSGSHATQWCPSCAGQAWSGCHRHWQGVGWFTPPPPPLPKAVASAASFPVGASQLPAIWLPRTGPSAAVWAEIIARRNGQDIGRAALAATLLQLAAARALQRSYVPAQQKDAAASHMSPALALLHSLPAERSAQRRRATRAASPALPIDGSIYRSRARPAAKGFDTGRTTWTGSSAAELRCEMKGRRNLYDVHVVQARCRHMLDSTASWRWGDHQ
jgi:hypothetical protein